MIDKEKLRNEARRQGQEYSRKIIEQYDSFWRSTHWDFTRRHVAAWMVRNAQKLAVQTAQEWHVLEIGCGIGFTTLEVAKRGAPLISRIIALDASARALEVAEKLKGESAEHIQKTVHFSEGYFFDHDGGPYHMIYMNEVIEHMPDIDAVFQKVSTLLYPNGLFFVSTPNRERFGNRVRCLFNKKPELIDNFHIKEYTLDELKHVPAPMHAAVCTGRRLLDETTLGGILAFGNKRIFKIIQPLVNYLIMTRINYYCGMLFPRLSSELLIGYIKD